MSKEDIAEALGTTFIEDVSLDEMQDITEETDNEFEIVPIQADSSLVSVSAVETNFDNEESVYIREKLRTVSEVAGQFFGMVAKEFQQAPTAKMAESASKVLDTQVSALNKLADMDEHRKKRVAKGEPAQPNMNASEDININNNTIITNREDLLKVIKEQGAKKPMINVNEVNDEI